MIDLEKLRAVCTGADGNIVVTPRWLQQVLNELEAAREANTRLPPPVLDLPPRVHRG